jgi:hypothetical protein
VVLPPEPPELTPGAARALLKILVKAYEQQAEAIGALEDVDHGECQPRTSHTGALGASAPSTAQGSGDDCEQAS